jgi:hypothetical protein
VFEAHGKGRRHRCSFCRNVFKREAGLRRHLQRRHGGVVQMVREEQARAPNPPRENPNPRREIPALEEEASFETDLYPDLSQEPPEMTTSPGEAVPPLRLQRSPEGLGWAVSPEGPAPPRPVAPPALPCLSESTPEPHSGESATPEPHSGESAIPEPHSGESAIPESRSDLSACPELRSDLSASNPPCPLC